MITSQTPKSSSDSASLLIWATNALNNTHGLFLILIFISIHFLACSPKESIAPEAVWPEITKEHKPWTRWWWMGNGVSREGIEAQLVAFSEAGMGGVEITPIYGVRGYEEQYIDFLSDEWMDMLQFTIQKADELGLGVDMNLGTGWPFGGPQITPAEAASKLVLQSYSIEAGKKPEMMISIEDRRQQKEDVELLALMAYEQDGKVTDIKDFLSKDGRLDWTPGSDGEIVAAFNAKTRQKVKRAAPGGQGWTMDHFSDEALQVYLQKFDEAFERIQERPRSFFNDSFEVYGSSGTKDIFQEFKERRGYDLSLHLQALGSSIDTEENRRVQSDYRKTIGELLKEEFTQPWTDWSHSHNALTKNQAHGSPGNLLDLYGTVDIPECETFGSTYFPIPGLRRDSSDIRIENEVPDPMMLKFASSAANVTGKQFVSSETFTWLAEHFRVSLSQCKPEVEQAFLSGVNHVFYHGTTYSPTEAVWPGWLFYASVQFGPDNTFWPHIIGLNEYIARSQSVLQLGTAGNEILMYFPMHDVWNTVGRLDKQLAIHDISHWLHPTDFYKESTKLGREGYALDYASDSFIANFSAIDGEISYKGSGNSYKVLIVPECELMPLTTLSNILELAKKGATVIFRQLPKDVPGLNELEERRAELSTILNSIEFENDDRGSQVAEIGEGKVILANDLSDVLNDINIYPEKIQQSGLKFIKRKDEGDTYYYLVNHTPEDIDEEIELRANAENAILMDPNHGDFGKIENISAGGSARIRVQLASGESIIVRCTNKDVAAISGWKYIETAKERISINKPWKLTFSKGGPELPEPVVLDELVSWTELGDAKAENFSGSGIYENEITINGPLEDEYILDLGKVAESARVWVNGDEVAVLWSIPARVKIGQYLKEGKNSIRIEVANLMANRIRYMDQNNIEWRIFHEINFVNIRYKPFDATNWKPMPSGLLGPVTIEAVQVH